MERTTMCYIRRNGQTLMLYRNAEKDDINAGKWIGVGGHCFEDESPEACILREVKEETGLALKGVTLRGELYFISDCAEGEHIWVYTAEDFTGDVGPCDEGELHWVEDDRVLSLPTWAGDRYFLERLYPVPQEKPFCLTLRYHGDELLSVEVQS